MEFFGFGILSDVQMKENLHKKFLVLDEQNTFMSEASGFWYFDLSFLNLFFGDGFPKLFIFYQVCFLNM